MAEEGHALAEMARAAATQMRGALKWIADPANAQKVGAARTALERDIQRTVVETERLAVAAERPMCIAVFGESQAGKSHLISVLARKGDALKVRFEGRTDTVDYLNAINPDRGKEATGLVTRFTVKPMAAPPGYPVILRLLDNADLVKIIANAYQFDGRAQKFERTPEPSEIQAHLARFEAIRPATAPNGLVQEGVWDIQQYFKTHLGEFSLSQRLLEANFFERAAALAPGLGIGDLGAFWSILWGGHEVLTALYVELVEGLAKLAFAHTVYCPWPALDRDAGSIIDVETLAGLGMADQNEIAVRTPLGNDVPLPRALVAALTAELRMHLAETPWKFLDQTDLLDFPGYRGRGLEELEAPDGRRGLAVNLAQKRAETVKEMMLRGKVEYLFQRYTADLEITAMMLCVKDSNLNVKQLSTVVRDWIASTHGASPHDRLGKPTLLFFVLTKFDLHLGDKVSDASIPPEVRFEGRMTASLLEPFGASGESWTVKWTPERPFENCYLMRNPNVLAREYFEIEGTREVRVQPGKLGRFAELRKSFVGLPEVQRHFRDAERAWDEMMSLNDGGASYLAENLAPVCSPQTKAAQVRNRLLVLRDRVRSAIENWHVATDLESRLAERRAVADEVVGHVYDVHEVGEGFGTFLSRLMIENGGLTDRLQAVQMELPDRATTAQMAAANRAAALPRPGLSRSGGRQDSPAAPAGDLTSLEGRAARASVAYWIERMYGTAADLDGGAWSGAWSVMPPAMLRELVSELEAGARRLELVPQIAARIRDVGSVDGKDQFVSKSAIVAERCINRFVCGLGFDGRSPVDRPIVPIEDVERPAFSPLPFVNDERGLADHIGFFRRRVHDRHADYSDRFVADWAFCFHQLVLDNASSESGLTVDIEQNARLGSILTGLAAPV